MHVLIAPDSFKGSATAIEVADSIRLGWLDVRPDDTVTTLPMADGGEGTLEALAHAVPSAIGESAMAEGPSGARSVPWLLLQDGTAVVELAAACGLPLWPHPDALGAHTHALGQVLRVAATDPRVQRLVVALGGSASTDAGTGALAALGAQLLGEDGAALPRGGAALAALARVDLSNLVAAPRGGVELLVDVDAPLLGPHGAAAQFAPQKGASGPDVDLLERALARCSELLGGDSTAPGSGAAGGTAYGLATVWGARLSSGSSTVADLVGLRDRLRATDLVVTGEGCLDEQSLRGKVVGHVAAVAADLGVETWACVGRSDMAPGRTLTHVCSLVDIATSTQAALAEPQAWLREAGRRLAVRAHEVDERPVHAG